MAVMARTRAAAKAAEDYVRAKPWNAVGIAAAAGFSLASWPHAAERFS